MNEHLENKNTLWDYTKCEIRTHTITYSIEKTKRTNSREKYLFKKVNEIEQNLDSKGDSYTEYLQYKNEWENLIQSKNNGIRLRSKAKWVEDGERNTKYFLNLEKRNYNNKYIRKLLIDNNIEITNPKDIILEERKFYETLYTSNTEKLAENIDDKFLNSCRVPTLSEEDSNFCEAALTIDECTKALKLLPNDKSPGPDGLTTNFYKFFWVDIKDIFFESLQYSFNEKCLSKDQKLGILNLIPKGTKDLRFLSNWRPVSLLQTDYKILTKALALRLQTVLPKIINADQVGYIPGRYIGENIRTIADLMSYTCKNKIPGYIVLIDFRKAFDTIELPFLFKSLKKFNFGPGFINWIETLYSNISSCVGNNGYYSDYFKLSRGIRQGCPISALLFIIVAEIVAIHIRQNPLIKGLTIDGHQFKIRMLADDTTLIVSDINSIEIAIKTFKDFGLCSGLKLNLEKTEIIPLGINRKKPIKSSALHKLKVEGGPFKTLGVWFSHNTKEMVDLNFNEKIENMEKLLFIWTSRNLSLKGKITIIKSLILPQILFLLTLIYVPKYILDKIEKLFLSFLWNFKPAKIKKETIIAPIREGGLNMIDIYSMHTAAKCSWIKRIWCGEIVNWKVLMLKMLSLNKNILNKKVQLDSKSKCLSPFHEQVLESWYKVYCTNPVEDSEIFNEYVLYNKE